MRLRARFALLLLVIVMFLDRSGLTQQTAPRKPGESVTPEAMTVEATVQSSRVHCEIPSCVQKVLYFSNITQPYELQDVTNAMRTIAEIGRVQEIPGARIIIVEGTAEQVALAEKLAAEIDKDKRRFGGLGYRIELKIQESGSGKKGYTRLYSVLTEARETARVSAGRMGSGSLSAGKLSSGKPVDSKTPNAPNPENLQEADFGNGGDIECRILSENENSIELNLVLTVGSGSERESGARGRVPFTVKQNVTVQLGKPTVISTVDDPEGGRTFTVELTATRVKETS